MPFTPVVDGDIQMIDLTAGDDAIRIDSMMSHVQIGQEGNTGLQEEDADDSDYVHVEQQEENSDDEDDVVIDLDGEDDDDDDVDEEDNVLRELDDEEIWTFKEQLASRAALPPGHKFVKSATNEYGVLVKAGSTVQRADDDFLLVKRVVREPTGNIYLLGVLMQRNGNVHKRFSERLGCNLHSFLPMKLNDVCMITKTDRQDLNQVSSHDALEKMSLNDVVCHRQIVFTNFEYKHLYYWHYNFSIEAHGEDHIAEHAPLFCRWKYIESIDIAAKKARIFKLAVLETHGCDKHKAQAAHLQRRGYGRNSNPSGSYSAADVCAGGGGASRGAHMAELDLVWALDHWIVAVASLRANGLHRVVLEQSVDQFVCTITLSFSRRYQVDVIHISFPCQGHSHRNHGQNPERDMLNNEVMTSLGPILDKLRPRVVTMEQTDGILSKNEGWWLRKTIQEFSSRGYSTTWKVCRMVDHGVACLRKRLIVMAACPGQQLPSWPPKTHGTAPGLLPPVTYNQAVAHIPRHATLHDVRSNKLQQANRPNTRLTAINGNEPLRRIIATDGIQSLDPTGTYVPTWREQLRVMSFPDHHRLCGKTRKDFNTQIGNSVPPEFMRVLFLQVIKALRKSDGETDRYQADNTVDLS